MPTVSVLYFAGLREIAGKPDDTVTLSEGAGVSDLVAEIRSRAPALAAALPSARVAVNRQFASPDRLLAEGDEVALIPPVAGGAPSFAVSSSPVDPAETAIGLADNGCGALVCFVGLVRENAEGRGVSALDYECYEPMAVSKMEEVGAEATALWPSVKVRGTHRVGHLVPGDVAVVLAAAAPHREEAFAACRHLIERIKQDVPIWKKEHFSDGSATWVGGVQSE